MTNEKILKTEILRDEQLDSINGGVWIGQQGRPGVNVATEKAEYIPPASTARVGMKPLMTII
ncbi:MAG: hypothetical protein SR2Q5_01750 [Quinella sp. 2Q5]|nr:hypothetical protein [Quinella sp. 2Q5]